MNAIWAVPSLGIDPTTGQEIYVRKDGTLTYEYDAQDQVVAGISDPKYRGNFGFAAEYKGFGLSATCTFLGGGQRYNTTLVNKVENVDIHYNVDRRVLYGRWQTPGQNAMFKKLGSYTDENGKQHDEKTRATTRFVQDNNELTFSSLSLYYEFNPRLISKIRLKRLKLAFYMNNIGHALVDPHRARHDLSLRTEHVVPADRNLLTQTTEAMKNSIKYLLLSAAALAAVSCESWLDVTPPSEIRAEAHYSSAEGFQQTLIGCYLAMGETDLYGENLTWHMVEILGRQYDARKNTAADDYDLDRYNYKTTKSTEVIEKVWEKSYSVIANVNDALDHIDRRKDDSTRSTTASSRANCSP